MANDNNKLQKVIDIIQWVLIILLSIFCIGVFLYRDTFVENYNLNKISRTDSTYIRIYTTQKISELERMNKALYDSLKHMKDVESAVGVKYVYKCKTDTVYVDKFVIGNDSVYTYRNDNDTVSTEIKIKAKDLEWCNVDSEINDKFTVITRENDGNVQTSITHSENVTVSDANMWKRKETFSDRLKFGPSVGFGYGVNSETVDVFVGFSITYTF